MIGALIYYEKIAKPTAEQFFLENKNIRLAMLACMATLHVVDYVFQNRFEDSGGQVFLTAGVHELPDMVKAAAIQRVATFDAFTEDNDPYGEHDFGSFDLWGRQFFWKIDLYEEPGVKDKSGEPVVTRVLTIMLASEY